MAAAGLLRAAALALLPVLLVACGDDEPAVDLAAAPYTVTLPEGWSEGTEAEKAELGLQAGTALEEAAGTELELPEVGLTSLWLRGEAARDTPNAVVFREPVPEGLGPAEFVAASLENVLGAFSEQIAEPPEEQPEADVAGEPAPAYDYTIQFGSRTLAKRAVFILHDGFAYTLTLTSPPEQFKRAAAELDEILASWTWN